MPKLSIITVNLNNCEGLRRTIKSVKCQSFTDYEYIIIDGGSSDGSIDVIKKYPEHFTYWVSEPDSGIYNAMNKGIKKANGEYCLFLNSGDYLVSNETLNNFFLYNYSEDFIYGDIIYDNEVGKKNSTLLPEKLNILFFYTSSLWHQATFIKRNLFLIFEFYNENNKLVSDWEFFLKRIILDNCSYRKIDMIISHYDAKNGLSVINNDLRLKEQKDSFIRTIPNYTKELLDDYLLLDNEKKALTESYISILHKKLNKFLKINF